MVDVDEVLAQAPSASLDPPAAVALQLDRLCGQLQAPLWRRTQAWGASRSCPSPWVGWWGCEPSKSRMASAAVGLETPAAGEETTQRQPCRSTASDSVEGRKMG